MELIIKQGGSVIYSDSESDSEGGRPEFFSSLRQSGAAPPPPPLLPLPRPKLRRRRRSAYEKALGVDAAQCESLHALRKAVREVRSSVPVFQFQVFQFQHSSSSVPVPVPLFHCFCVPDFQWSGIPVFQFHCSSVPVPQYHCSTVPLFRYSGVPVRNPAAVQTFRPFLLWTALSSSPPVPFRSFPSGADAVRLGVLR